MNRLLALALTALTLGGLTLSATPALAQDANLQRGLDAFNAGNDELAAPLLFESQDPKAQLTLAQSFARRRLPMSALLTYASIVNQGPSHPFQLEAVQGLVEMQALLDEQNLVPNVLAQDLIAEPSSDVLNVVGFYAGFSILF